MGNLESFHLEEYGGLKFFIEYVGSYSDMDWFKIHTTNGQTHNLTILQSETVDEAREKIINEYKLFLDGYIKTL